MSKKFSEGLLNRTIKIWQPHSKEKLTPDDAYEICTNATNLIRLLNEIDRKSVVDEGVKK